MVSTIWEIVATFVLCRKLQDGHHVPSLYHLNKVWVGQK